MATNRPLLKVICEGKTIPYPRPGSTYRIRRVAPDYWHAVEYTEADRTRNTYPWTFDHFVVQRVIDYFIRKNGVVEYF